MKQVLYRYTHHATSSNSETCDSSTSIKHEFPKMPCTTFMRLHMASPASYGRYVSTFQEMFKECAKRIPSLRKINCPMVTDKECAIVKASKASYQQLEYFTAGTTFSGTFDCGVASMGLLQQTSQSTVRTYSSYFIWQPKRGTKRSYVKGNTHGMPHLKHTTCKRSI